MQRLTATRRIFFLCFASLLSMYAVSQTATALTTYRNDKYEFSFSYPSAFLIDIVNDDEWIIRNTERTWAVGGKIIHLQGSSVTNYLNSISSSLYPTLAKAYGLANTANGVPEKNPYSNYTVSGFDFNLYISGSMGSGSDLEKLTNSWSLYLNVFTKTSQAGFVPDGILLWDFRQPLDNDGHKLTKLVLKTLEKTIIFKQPIVVQPVVPTVAKKNPVTPTQPVKKTNPVPTTSKPTNKLKTGKIIELRAVAGSYQTVTIGTQTWLSENLDVRVFLNGDPIPEVKSAEEWKMAGINRKPAWCYYNNNPDNGKLYNWFAVHDKRGLAPKGWHVPTYDEFEKMIKYLGGDEIAPNKLIAGAAWKISIPGNTESGFNGMPCKWRTGEGKFTDDFISEGWWTSSYKNYIDAATLYMLYYANTAMDLSIQGSDKKLGASVRCIKN